MAKLAVVQGAILKCDKGLTPSPLTVTPPSFSQVEGSPVATIMDHLAGENIKPFGVCAILKGPCVPTTPVPWFPGETGIPLLPSQYPILSNVSLLPCAIGGLIQITSPGQSTVVIDSIFTSHADARLALAIEKARNANDKNLLSQILLKAGWDALTGGAGGYAAWKEKVLRKRAATFRANAQKVKVRNLLLALLRRQRAARSAEKKRKKALEDKARRTQNASNRFRWARRGAGIAGWVGTGVESAKHVGRGNYGDAAATAGGGAIAAGTSGACFAAVTYFSGGLSLPASAAVGAGCGVVGGVVGDRATPLVKKIGDGVTEEAKRIGRGFRFLGGRR